MCARYYVDNETDRLIEKMTGCALQKTKGRKDIFPTEQALVLTDTGKQTLCKKMRWGFPGPDNNRLVINARSEEAFEKKLFALSMQTRRCVIPAAGFYEWNAGKEKFTFSMEGGAPLFFAGCYDLKGGSDRFVILTTKANASVQRVHDRMPLVLDLQELAAYLRDEKSAERLLLKTPPGLKVLADYEQMSLFDREPSQAFDEI